MPNWSGILSEITAERLRARLGVCKTDGAGADARLVFVVRLGCPTRFGCSLSDLGAAFG